MSEQPTSRGLKRVGFLVSILAVGYGGYLASPNSAFEYMGIALIALGGIIIGLL